MSYVDLVIRRQSYEKRVSKVVAESSVRGTSVEYRAYVALSETDITRESKIRASDNYTFKDAGTQELSIYRTEMFHVLITVSTKRSELGLCTRRTCL